MIADVATLDALWHGEAGVTSGKKSNTSQQAASSARTAPGSSSRLQAPPIFAYVDAVARHGSIRKAADALHIASSALNRRILDLEGELGSPLFERLPRGVRATAAGELFLAFARRSMKELRQVEEQIEGLKGLVHGEVRIAVAESVTGRMLPDAIREYQRQHPGIRFSVTVEGPQRINEALLRDQADLVLTHETPDTPEISVLASVTQPLCALVAPEHPLASRSTLRLVDCVEYPIALPDHTLAARSLIDAALKRAAAEFEPAIVSNSIEATKVFARTCQGVCFSFRIGNKPDVSGMVAVPLTDWGLADARLNLAYRRGRVLPVAAAAFAEQLTEVLKTL